MKINSICVIGYGEPSGTLEVAFDGCTTKIVLAPHDAQQVMYLAERLYEQHQMQLSEEFAKPLPALADFSEVPS